MQRHEDESEHLSIEVNRMLRGLPRERQPDPALEEAIAAQLMSRRLLVSAEEVARVGVRGARRARLALSWPVAAAAAAVLFVSGVVVGASGSRTAAPAASQASVATVQSRGSAPPPGGDLFLAADKRTSITRAIKF